ncbi:hypothetical protein OROMI_023560 [Orobanche minor]
MARSSYAEKIAGPKLKEDYRFEKIPTDDLLTQINQEWSDAIIIKIPDRSWTVEMIRVRLDSFWNLQGKYELVDVEPNLYIIRNLDPIKREKFSGRPLGKLPVILLLSEVVSGVQSDTFQGRDDHNLGQDRQSSAPIIYESHFTSNCIGRYARICIYVDLSKPLEKGIEINNTREEGGINDKVNENPAIDVPAADDENLLKDSDTDGYEPWLQLKETKSQEIGFQKWTPLAPLQTTSKGKIPQHQNPGEHPMTGKSRVGNKFAVLRNLDKEKTPTHEDRHVSDHTPEPDINMGHGSWMHGNIQSPFRHHGDTGWGGGSFHDKQHEEMDTLPSSSGANGLHHVP